MYLFHKPKDDFKSFRKILQTYEPSDQTIAAGSDGHLVLLVAPAAAGRNSIIKNLILTGKYFFIVSDTTRPARMNDGMLEANGREYWFVSKDEFKRKLKSGDYLGPSLIHDQQLSGINVDELTKAHAAGKIPITDVEIVGCDLIMRAKADTFAIFVLPPSFNEWMRRLDSRGAMAKDEKRRRLESAVKEITFALSKQYFIYVINWDLRATCQRIHELVTEGLYSDSDEQVLASNHARQLLTDIASWLEENK